MAAKPPGENQRLHLARSLVEIEDYATALRLIERMPHWYLATNYEVAVSICRALDKNFIDPMYKRLGTVTGDRKPAGPWSKRDIINWYRFNQLSSCLREKHLRNSLNKTSASSTMARSNSSQHQNRAAAVDVEMRSSEDEQVNTEQMLERFVVHVLPVLSALGPAVSYDTVLFTKLIRVCQAFLTEKRFECLTSIPTAPATQASSVGGVGVDQKEQTPPPATKSGGDEDRLAPSQIVKQMNRCELAFFNQIYTLLNEILLPSLSMLNMNPCVAIELWNLLKLFPYEMRFDFVTNT